jgi:DNA-directed RNA polymerase specialized sigma24 family protein
MENSDVVKKVERAVRNWSTRLEDAEQSEVECLIALWKNGTEFSDRVIKQTLINETWKSRHCRPETWRDGKAPELPVYLDDLFPDGEEDSRWNLTVDGPEEKVVIDLSLDEFEAFLEKRDHRGREQVRLFRLWRGGMDTPEIGATMGRSQRAVWNVLNRTIFPALRTFWGES